MKRRFLIATTFLSVLLVSPSLLSALAEDSNTVANSIQNARNLSDAFAHVADQITPSMVSVSSLTKAKRVGTRNNKRGNMNDPFFDHFRDFFGDDFMDRFGGGQDSPNSPSQQGLGTGVIIDDKGHILTNNHVIGDADEVRVRLHDKRSFKAEIVGSDPRSDLAVIKIKADGLIPAKLGDSDKLKIGEWVVAAGNPFGLDNSITAGIVSAKGRSLVGGAQYEDFIQTDAAINPGNSGGPLVNLEGEVVGINTAIFSRSGGYMGIGFAIPITMARKVMESLISKGKVVRGWLGIGIQNLTEDLARSFNYTGSDGALVGHIENNGPAAKAGIQQGDIIVKLGNDKINDVNQLRNLVASLVPGTTISVELLRDSRTKIVDVKVGELPSSVGSEAPQPNPSTESDLGISVENLSVDLARKLKSKHSEGVVVTGVRPDGIAAQNGLQTRDIIISVNSEKIRNVEEFLDAIKRADLNKGVRLVVESQGMEHYLFLRGEEE
jgi:serine protease Do